MGKRAKSTKIVATKLDVYEKQIKPLTQQIIEICKQYQVPALMAFEGKETDDNVEIIVDGYMTKDMSDALHLCAEILSKPNIAVLFRILADRSAPITKKVEEFPPS